MIQRSASIEIKSQDLKCVGYCGVDLPFVAAVYLSIPVLVLIVATIWFVVRRVARGRKSARFIGKPQRADHA